LQYFCLKNLEISNKIKIKMAKILGMGNALVDILIRVPDEKLFQKFDMLKGGNKLVDDNFTSDLLSAVSHLPIEKAPGGSAANTINGLANLGLEVGFIGKVGKDEFGKFMEDDMIANNIKPLLLKGTAPTGLAVALITPDSERTFAVKLGSAIEMVADELKPEMFQGYDYFHIEGYLVQNHDLLRTAVKLAKQAGVRISLDLASFDVVAANLDFLKEILVDYVDILFANEQEAHSFTGLDPELALHEISKNSEIAIVKIGEKGSLVKYNEDVCKIGIIEAKSIDTTGAGDLYAAGFLFGLASGLPIEKCGRIGSLLAGKVIETIGAKMNDLTWKYICERVNEIVNE
jgi:sugar/nucleoside kinase (ribokinase family)